MSEAGRAAWLAWKLRTFGDEKSIWHDGLGVELVTRLRGAARADALAMLRQGLALGDVHAARALAAMDDHDSAAAVRAALDRSAGNERVWLAVTLHQRHREPALASHLIAVLQAIDPQQSWGAGRFDAAIGLRHFAGRDAEAALLVAVADAQYLVRYHACESLIFRWKIKPPSITKHPDIFAEIRDDAGDHALARERLRALARRRPIA
ncbi:hypothetical protein [Nannocystis sp.]|uniref:hypothetical protein n=1 Tax=Nannocystis sp. TaxID=1962667 RepID=UPI0025F10D78|nr:hypothetical protein [Nannocystis sp.]MBK7828099.1 hypothetical protein [Nannocystis sp.]